MLKDRVFLSSNKFYVAKAAADSRRTLHYRIFSLADDWMDMSRLTPMPYWNPKDELHTRIPLDDGQYVLLVEMENQQTIERHAFYHAGSVSIKQDLDIVVSKNKKYGRNAYLITIEWSGDEEPEPINSRYVCLKNGRGDRFYFLQETLTPLEPFGKRKMDEYVFELPEGDQVENYSIDIHPLVKERYRISIEM